MLCDKSFFFLVRGWLFILEECACIQSEGELFIVGKFKHMFILSKFKHDSWSGQSHAHRSPLSTIFEDECCATKVFFLVRGWLFIWEKCACIQSEGELFIVGKFKHGHLLTGHLLAIYLLAIYWPFTYYSGH